jgi:hypothetical protein
MAEAYNKVKIVPALVGTTLESTEAATQAVASRKIIDTYFSTQLNLVVKYTTGAAEAATNAYVKVWGYIGTKASNTNYPYANTEDTDIANDTDNWIQIGTFNLSSGTAVFTPSVYKVVGGAGATIYSKHFAVGITFPKIRVSAYEDGVAANKGTVTVLVLIQ